MTGTRLSELCVIQSGGTPRRERDGFYGGSIPWAKIADLETADGVVTTTEETLTESGAAAIGGRVFPPGTVLLAMYGSVGKVAVAGTLMATNQAVLGLRVTRPDVLSSEYLRRWLEYSQPKLVSEARGVTQQNISATIVRDLRIPLPSLAEQRRIAAVLDKADGVRRKRRESLGLLDVFLRSAFLEMFGDPVRNEKGWEVGRLGNLADFVGGGTPDRSVKRYFDGPICWATSKDIRGEMLVDTQEHVTPEAIERSATKLVAPGTILVVVKSKILMHRLPVAITAVPTCFGQDLKGVIPHGDLPVRYVARHLRVGERGLLAKARGVNTEGLTLEHLREYRVMLPPAGLLRRLDQLEERHGAVIEKGRAYLTQSEALFDSLAQRAFGVGA